MSRSCPEFSEQRIIPVSGQPKREQTRRSQEAHIGILEVRSFFGATEELPGSRSFLRGPDLAAIRLQLECMMTFEITLRTTSTHVLPAFRRPRVPQISLRQ